jgi:type IV secretory pathway TraG/TraD family ATPase VirD4
MRHRESGEPSILFLLDEFAALGHMQIVESVWSVVRGYGIQMMPILHDLSQLKSLYKERWETYIGNAGATAFFAPNDLTTADWLSKRLGETTRMMHSRSETSGKTTISTTPVKVPYMTPHQLHGLPAGHMMLINGGLSHGAEIYLPPYYRIEERKARARVNPYVHPVPRRLDLPPPASANGDFWLQTPGKAVQKK